MAYNLPLRDHLQSEQPGFLTPNDVGRITENVKDKERRKERREGGVIYGTDAHGAENFVLMSLSHQLLYGLLTNDYLPRVSGQSRLWDNRVK